MTHPLLVIYGKPPLPPPPPWLEPQLLYTHSYIYCNIMITMEKPQALKILRNSNCLKKSLRQNFRTHGKATNNSQLFFCFQKCVNESSTSCPVSLLEPSLECIKLARFTVSISSPKKVKQVSNYIQDSVCTTPKS